MTNKICNKCSKKIVKTPCSEGQYISHEFSYESRFDGRTLEVDLCDNCYDNSITDFVKTLLIKPDEWEEYSYTETLENQNKMLQKLISSYQEDIECNNEEIKRVGK
jgi:hypothetical protein